MESMSASFDDGGKIPGRLALAAPIGVHARNGYTTWFARDRDLEGQWNRYDGSEPPWNDSIVGICSSNPCLA